jgi:hypothetical protein
MENNIVGDIIGGIQVNLNPLQDLLFNAIHNMRAMKYSVERFVTLYIERFVWYIRLVYGRDKILEKFEPGIYRVLAREMKQRTPERERLENRAKMLECLGRDYDTLEKFIRENDQAISSTAATDLLERFEIILNLMRLEAMDFVLGCHKYRKIPLVQYVIEAVVWIRKDIDKGALKMINIDPNDDTDEDGNF